MLHQKHPKQNYKARNIGRRILVIAFFLLSAGCTQQTIADLKATDTPTAESLITVLSAYDPLVRAQAARDLGEKGNILAIEPLIGLLDDYQSEEVQQIAIEALVKFGYLAIDPLITSLENGSISARENTVAALNQIDDDRVIEPLLRVLLSENTDVQQAAADALGKREIEDRAIEPVIAAVLDEDPDVREAAARALGMIKEARAVNSLITATTLYDKDEYLVLSQYAIESLVKIGAPSVDPLIVLLGNDDGWIQDNAAEALGNIGEPAVEPLIAALKDENPGLRTYAASALGDIKDARAIEPLLITLRDEDNNVSSRSREALSSIGAPAIEPFIALLKDKDPKIRREAVLGLRFIEDERVIEPLIGALKDQDAYVRVAAAEAFEEINDTRAVEPLIAALSDADQRVRWHAVNSLGELLDTRSVEGLINALRDKDDNVRDAAAQVLTYLGEPAVAPLLSALETQDLRIVASAYRFFIQRGEMGSEESLIRALAKYGSLEMANDFLHCGNSLLMDSAITWAHDNDYIIETSERPIQIEVVWGKK